MKALLKQALALDIFINEGKTCKDDFTGLIEMGLNPKIAILWQEYENKSHNAIISHCRIN